MQFRSILTTMLVVLLVFSAVPCPVFANGNGDLISELSVLDVFHPPDADDQYRADLYNEWHYFNMIDEEQNIAVVTSLKLNGNVSNPTAFPMTSSAQVLLSYEISGIPNTKYGIYSPTLEAEFSGDETYLRIASSMVNLTPEGYHVHVESDDGSAVFDALFKPLAEPSFMSSSDISEMIDMNWLVASPMMLVEGTLTINEGSFGPLVFTFEDAKGYHDHNWGYWNWANLRWDWGQVTRNTIPEDADDRYTLSLGNVTSASGAQLGQVMNVWKNDTIVTNFSELRVVPITTGEFDTSLLIPHLPPGLTVELPASLCYPEQTAIQASDGPGSTINVLFDAEQAIPLPVATVDSSGEATLLIIWELLGTYHVEAIIEGTPVSFTARGFMEDAGLMELYVPPEITVDIEKLPIAIGSGEDQYNFAIISDLQYDPNDVVSVLALQSAVDEIISLNNNGIVTDDVEFVVVLGDIIQGRNTATTGWKGESEYRLEYEQVIAELERLKLPLPTGAGIDYVPVIGNHDVWFKFNGYSTSGGWPDYPEELYSYYFGPQYERLSVEMDGWEKQDAMPSGNPYDTRFPAPEFQNFAFDYGPYHFICLDFCARDDFDPYDESGFPPTIRKFEGYADLHDQDPSDTVIENGTWQWLNEHLSECNEKGIENVVVFTHHPPVYELDTMPGSVAVLNTGGIPMVSSSSTEIAGEIHIQDDPLAMLDGFTLSNYRTGTSFIDWDDQVMADGTSVDRVEGDTLLAFNKKEYDGKDEYDELASVFDEYGINIVHWFSGHYHLKGLQWYDSDISEVSLVPSVVPASGIYSIQFDGNVMINEIPGAIVTPEINPNGSIAIVTVKEITEPADELSILEFSPGDLTLETTVGDSQEFNVRTNQNCNIEWYIDGVLVETDSSVSFASYVNTTASAGSYNVTAIAENLNGTDQETWTWYVRSKNYYTGNRVWDASTLPSLDYTWTGMSYSGFYYDLDSGMGSETLTIHLDSYSDRTVGSGDLEYSARPITTDFEHNDWGSYQIIGFMGEKYFAGYTENTDFADEPVSMMSQGQLSKILMDDDDKISAYSGSSLLLEGEYALDIVEIDTNVSNVYVSLKKDGLEVGTASVSPDSTYVYEKDIGSVDDVPIIAVHFGDIFSGIETTAIFVEGIFQISDDYIEVESGDSYGEMEVTSISSSEITMENEDSFSLSRGDIIDIMGKLKFEVADDSTLRFALFVDISEPGTYELRGTVAENEGLEWTALNFEGFYYNIDEGIGAESLEVTYTGRTIDDGDLVYTSTIRNVNYESINLGDTYPFLGLFGEKYVPITSTDAGKLAKLLIDDNTEHSLRTGDPLYLGGGFALTAKEIDVGGDKVWMELSKDGEFVEDEVVDISAGAATWTYERDNVAGEDDVEVFKVHVTDILDNENLTIVEGMWLIDYDNILEIESGDKFGEMEVKSVGTSLVLKNSGSLNLTAGSTVDIADGLKFKVADSATLRYYPFMEVEIYILSILDFSPSDSTPGSFEGDLQEFDIRTNNVCNVTWTIDDIVVKTDTSVTFSSYENSSASAGSYNVAAIAQNGTETRTVEWTWTVTSVPAEDGSYVQGPVYNGTNLDAIFASEGINDISTFYEWDCYLEMNATNFAGFYHDIDNDVSTEVFRIYNTSASGGTDYITGDRTIDEGGIVYTTTISYVKYNSSNLWGIYPILGWFGEKYIPVTDIGACNLVIDDNTEHSLRTGDPLDLGSGFALTAKQIDVEGDKVWMELSKDGEFVVDEVVDVTNGAATWTYERDNVAGQDDVNVFMVHVTDVFQGQVDSLAVVEGMWLIDYTDILEIEIGDKFGELEVQTIADSLVLENSGPVTLTANSIVDIADGLKFKVEDSDDVIFCLVKGFIEPADELSILDFSPSDSTPGSFEGDLQEFDIRTNKVCNVTWTVDDIVVKTDSSVTSSSYENSSASAGSYNVKAIAQNGTDIGTVEWAWTVTGVPAPAPVISLLDPSSSSVSDYIGASRTFTVNVSQIANVTWILDGTVLHINESVQEASYYCSSAELGVHNLTVVAQNEIGMDQKCWNWTVRTIPEGIELCPGWHFISVPCELCDPGIDQVLECVTYDALTCYNSETCLWETVSSIEPLKGYWLHIPEWCGTQVIPEEALEPAVTPYTQATQLFEGWNAIGCCESADALSAEEALACIDGCYTCIFGPWDPVTMSYEYFGHNGESGLISGRHIGTESFGMEKYRGYWVYATSDTVLVEKEDNLFDS